MGLRVKDDASPRDCIVAEHAQSFTIDLQRNTMSIQLNLFVLLLSGVGVSSLVFAQDDEAPNYEMLVHSLTSGDPRELAEPLMSLPPVRGDVITMRERGRLILRIKPEQREEVLELLEKRDQPKRAIRTQVYVLRATEAHSDEDLNGFSGKFDSESPHVTS